MYWIDVGGRGIGHGLRLATPVDGESEVDSHPARSENGEHGDGGEDQDGPALLLPVTPEPGPEALHQETVPSWMMLVDVMVDGVMSPRPGSSGKSGLSL